MELIVRHGERQEEVSLERRDDGTFIVSVGDRHYEIDVARAGDLLSLRVADGRQFEVAARPMPSRDRSIYQVSTARGQEQVEVTDPLTFLLEQANPSAGRGGITEALMPGRVVELLVAEGDAVSAGQGIVVVEAMKMKNEIQSEADGSVKCIHVEVGQTVEAGDPLFEIE